jgi:hypothetical protein
LGLHYVKSHGIFCTDPDLDVAHSHPEPLDALLAIATDLLAQSEAQQRSARRIDNAARQVVRLARERGSVGPALELLREHLAAMRAVVDSERALIEELDRELSGASN